MIELKNKQGEILMRVLYLLLFFLIQFINAKDSVMPNTLLVIAGLVDPSGINSKEIDASTSASKSINNKLYAYTTSEIAYQMKKYLEENNYNVDIISADNKQIDLNRYELIIIGSGIYGMMPHGSIKQFIQANESILKEKKVALFAVCGSLCTGSEQHKQKAFKFVDKMTLGLSPISKTVFRGNVKDSGSFFNWVGKQFFKTYPPGDYREWDVIKKWTQSLIRKTA
jgi:menaquinone-dependent protoporphyrinogen oxidase